MLYVILSVIALMAIMSIVVLLRPSREEGRWVIVLGVVVTSGAILGFVGYRLGWFDGSGGFGIFLALLAGAALLEIPRSISGSRAPKEN